MQKDTIQFLKTMQSRSLLILSTAAVVLVWQLPYGQQLLYPLTLLATYAHEMGHGLTALLTGAEFDQMLLHADGSGVAVWRGNPGRLASALIAAGGLIGPTIAGVTLLLASRKQRYARAVLATLSALLLVSMALWSRNTFGVAFLIAVAATLGLAAKAMPDAAAAFVLHLIAATLCLSWFIHLGYMFSAQAVVNGVAMPSDSAVIAQALWLPYWFWGAVVAALSLAVTALAVAKT
nr:M50 family metallopeptidase [Rhodoferax sp.]